MRAVGAHLERVQRQPQVVDGAGRAGEVEDEVDRLVDVDVLAHVDGAELEAVVAQVLDVLERARVQVVEADHPVALRSSRYSQRCEPRNPAPPVTTDVVMLRPLVSGRHVSVRAARAQHGAHRSPHDVQRRCAATRSRCTAGRGATMSSKRQVAAAADLPQPGDARQHDVAAPVPFFHELAVAQRQGARADEAHVALEHVEELRQLVEAEAPQQAADPVTRGSSLDLEEDAVGLVAAASSSACASCAPATMVRNL